MRVALINPSSPFLIDQDVHGSLGLWYLGAAIRDEHEVLYCDRGLGDALPDADVWCLTGTTPQRDEMAAIIAQAPVPVIVGGPHAIVAPLDEAILASHLTVRGEGEEILPMLLDDIPSGVILADRIRNLDSLPFPDRSQQHRYHYIIRDREGNKHEAATMITSRGCPHKCAFCAKTWGHKYTQRSAENVMAEVKELQEMGYDAIHFYDDSLALDRKRLWVLCRGFRERGLIWRCFVRADQMTPMILNDMALGGCVEIGLGVESGSQQILDNINKGETVEQQADCIKWAHQVGIRVKAFLIVGLAGETWDTIDETENFLHSTQPDDIDATILQVYPGSSIYQNPESYGITMHGSGWYKGRPGEYEAHHSTIDLSPADLVAARERLEMMFKGVKV